ncbi:MAG: CBS domain-containing protein [Phycisphaerales bacterium]|jgi:CBS domain-containing protein|nr:CBS domain-containing protein [Phycisphaerales bacterium]
MPTVTCYLDRSDPRPLISCRIGDTVLDAAKQMNAHHIGSLPVLEGDQLAGIVTERDVLKRVVAEGRDPATTTVADVMSSPVTIASPDAPLALLRTLMRDAHIRHIPIVEDGTPIAMMSIGDLNRAQADEQDETIHALEAYVNIR